MTPAIKLLLLGIVGLLLSNESKADDSVEPADPVDPVDPVDSGDSNVKAFLMTIRYAEGTAGSDGYRMNFGGSLFDSFANHPNRVLTVGKYRSSAAGAYQILKDTWFNVIQPVLHLPDFSPESQDAAAIFLIDQKGALGDVRSGQFDSAIEKVRKVWASLPGAGYNQPERSLEKVRAAFVSYGGNVA